MANGISEQFRLPLDAGHISRDHAITHPEHGIAHRNDMNDVVPNSRVEAGDLLLEHRLRACVRRAKAA